MREAVLIKAGDDVAVSALVYITYVFSHLGLIKAEYTLSVSLMLIPLIQHYLIKGGLFTYNGAVRVYASSMHALALTWLLIAVFMTVSLNNQLPLFIAAPFVVLAMAIGLTVRRESSLTATPLLLSSPILMLIGYSPQAIALLSLVPFITTSLILLQLRGRYGGRIGLSKLTPVVALLQFALYLLLSIITSITQVILTAVYLLMLIVLGIPLTKLRGRYLFIILLTLALASLMLKMIPLLCAVVIFTIRLLLLQ
ncbi:hypothetical protein [Caldivirga maquilingensis]|uniref:Uncharacterized protein n=1 Tax=Caldivirga maquilingensis (strain ATCC 700844 / DSM 13496 / JCM 10307 / IC-167) TaxID=397948 RepID=A8ME77_CALMQ|nr:hypothetical protein [Caldivirga maquilingensis]ABW02083.1 hypothetical protein Cmaq_1256 [Caldivirga maquilingensis IC-167]